jgi:hypothetical protein
VAGSRRRGGRRVGRRGRRSDRAGQADGRARTPHANTSPFTCSMARSRSTTSDSALGSTGCLSRTPKRSRRRRSSWRSTARTLRDRRLRLEDMVTGSELVFPVRRLALDGLGVRRLSSAPTRLRRQGRGSSYRGRADEAVVGGQAEKVDGRGGPLAAADQRGAPGGVPRVAMTTSRSRFVRGEVTYRQAASGC